MKRSLAHGSGYLVVDHRDSPGLSADDIARAPVPTDVLPGSTMTERDVMQCSHCQRGVILNPGRVRARAVCPKCMHYICDPCEAVRVKSGACVPYARVLDEMDAVVQKHAGQLDHPDIAAGLKAAQSPEARAPRIALTDPT